MKYFLDNMILTKESVTNAGSKMLENFSSLFEAEAVTRMENAGHSFAGKADCGEFGMDVAGETCFFSKSIGNSVAENIKSGKADIGLSVDNNGAPRRQAAICGISYLKPTYGMVSRYGIIPTACSSEGIGFTGPAEKIAEALSAVAGNDTKDGTTLPEKQYDFSVGDVKGKKIAILKNYAEEAEDDVKSKLCEAAEALRAAGAETEEISFDIADEIRAAWHIAFCAETCNNLSRYDGVKFGYRTPNYKNIEELYTGSRSAAFGLLTKSVILYGSDVLSKGRYEKCYDKALRMRRAAREKLTELFSRYDALILPACSTLSYTKEGLGNSIDALYREEFFSAVSSLTGIPCAVSGSIQILADTLKENNLLSVMAVTEGK